MSKFFKSLSHAINGFKIFITEEAHARIHLAFAFSVIQLGSILTISAYEWIALLLTIGFVISTEILNTSIENLADFVCTEKNEHIKKIKDLAAASVLFSAMMAVFIGLIIFIPKLGAFLHV